MSAAGDPLTAVRSALSRVALIPDVLPPTFTPSLFFSVVYPSGTEVLLGNVLTPAETSDEPAISLVPMTIPTEQAWSTGSSDKEASYTLVMLDPDAPTRAEPMYRSFRHWVVTGLKPPLPGGSRVASQAALHSKAATTPYRPPGPRPASGQHRYTFLLFEEPTGEAFEIPKGAPEYGATLEERRSWDAVKFGEQYGLKLVGANFFLVNAEKGEEA
ncbi:PEBP-like protein [Dentipellis sp. KUC8613]|nr:PEBP-like protein [Dentipellis sp. KUC8613]